MGAEADARGPGVACTPGHEYGADRGQLKASTGISVSPPSPPGPAGRTVGQGQLYRDLDRYTAGRDHWLRVGPTGPDGRAACVVGHDLRQDDALV